MKTILHSRWVWCMTSVVAVISSTVLLASVLTVEGAVEEVLDLRLYESYSSLRMKSVQDIVTNYEWNRIMFMPVLLPDTEYVLSQDGGVLPVTDWTGFSKEFIAGLVPVERDGVAYWPVRVMEDATANPRRRLILNAKDEVIAALPVPKDYDPAWWLKEHYPQLYAEDATKAAVDQRARMEAIFDGSRLVMEYDLIDHDNLLKLVLKQSMDAALRAQEEEEGGGMMMMGWQGGSVTNIQFVEIERTNTNGTMAVTLAYPDAFTNRISLIACTNLLDPDWSLLVTTNPPASTNAFTYTDIGATTRAVRFYHAYNADYDGDGDGVADGEERFLDGTDPEDPDDPPNVKGTVSYAGGQAGTIYVVAVTTSGSWSTSKADTLAAPGGYIIPKLSSGTYYVKAWRGSDADALLDTNEASAQYPTNLAVNGQVTNVNLTLVDPDTDADGLPDWWENAWFTNLTQAATGDYDADSLSNLGEYLAGANPKGVDTDGDNMGDLAEVAHGRNPAVADSYRSLTYTNGFETSTSGQIDGQNGWTASPSDKAVVQTAEKRSGSNALELLASAQTPTVNQFFGARGQNTVWLDYWAKMDPRAVTHFTNYADIAAAPACDPAVFSINRRGEVWAYSGTAGTWSTDTRFRIADYRYHRFTVKENLSAKTWDLHIDGIKAYSAVPFRKYLPDLWPRLASNTTVEVTNSNLGGTDVDCSGAAIMPSTGELLVIENGTPAIHAYDQSGAYRRSITLSEFTDTEGICHVQGDTFAVLEESRSSHQTNRITLVTITSNTTSIARSSGQSHDVIGVPYGDNLGLEGITYAGAGIFYVVKEKSPMGFYSVALANGAAYATSVPAVLNALASRVTDLSDLYFDQTAAHLYVLSHESSRIVQITLNGTVISQKTVVDPQSPYQPEGITISEDRMRLFVICEADELIRYRFDPVAGDYKDIAEFSRFTVAGSRGGGWYVDDITVGASQPASLYGTLQVNEWRVSANSDDADEVRSTGVMDLSGDLDIGYNDSSSTKHAGVRFSSVGLPASARIKTAYVQFTEANTDNKTKECPVDIAAQAHDNPTTFTTANYNISSRTTITNAVIRWDIPSWPGKLWADNEQRTVDLAWPVRSVVTRPGWVSGNAMVFILRSAQDVGNRREADDYSSPPSNYGPLLHVEWAPTLP